MIGIKKSQRQFGIPNITFIKNQSFFTQNNASIWQMYFYDDEDGASFLQVVSKHL
jgi:hypothetical protein